MHEEHFKCETGTALLCTTIDMSHFRLARLYYTIHVTLTIFLDVHEHLQIEKKIIWENIQVAVL